MRNLLGRLNARPPDDLVRIAKFWAIPLPSGDGSRHRQVGGLYRAMTDPRAVRDAWDRLATPERAAVRFMVLGQERAVGIADLAAHLALDTTEARRVAARLYRAGIIARDGDDESLPLGDAPRVFVPRELAQGFRRVNDEIEAGDLSDTPLRALLELLDDAELEEAATVWGIRVIPGLRRRDDLARQLLQQVADPARVTGVAAKRGPVAARIWTRLRAEERGDAVPFAAAAAAAELDPGVARTAAQLRIALAELEGALLIWHTYRPDGSRWLFVPAEIRAPRPGGPVPVAPPDAVASERLTPAPWRHPDALAWDVLTFAREVTLASAPRVEHPDAAPRPWLRRLNRLLWNRGEETPPPGYLGFLLALASGAGLLTRREEEDETTYEPTPALRAWRDRSFAEQTSRLREVWLGATDWIEGRGRTELAVWGADWRGFRGRLRALLDGLVPATPGTETWYLLGDIAAWAAARDPDLLGATFTAATARREDPSADAGERRRAAVADAVVAECETGLVWTGAIEFAALPGRGRALRVRRRRAEAGNVVPFPVPGAAKEPAISVSEAGEIALDRPSPLLVWSLSAFAATERLGEVSRYRLTPESLARALAAGFDLEQVTAFLGRQSGEPLPPELAAQLEAWTRGYRRVRLRRALLLTPDDPGALEDLTRALAQALAGKGGTPGAALHPIGDGRVLLELPDGASGDDEGTAGLLATLRAAGFTPQWG